MTIMPHMVVSSILAAGSSKVVINGRPAARVGDAVSIGGAVQNGSGNVIIGG